MTSFSPNDYFFPLMTRNVLQLTIMGKCNLVGPYFSDLSQGHWCLTFSGECAVLDSVELWNKNCKEMGR